METTTLTESEMLATADAHPVTALRGYVTTTRAHIESVFGKPTCDTESPDGKVTTEWVILLADGSIATIYDWKQYEDGAPKMFEEYMWHIGGHAADTAMIVNDLLA